VQVAERLGADLEQRRREFVDAFAGEAAELVDRAFDQLKR
jgi:hypothetical protein